MENFVRKIEVDSYKIGSFDVFFDKTQEFIKKKFNMSDEEALDYLKQIPTTYRAAIVNSNDEYVGFIGIKNVDLKNEMADIVFEVDSSVDTNESQALLKAYKTYLYDSINIKRYNEKPKKEKKTIVKSKYITPGVDELTLEKYLEMYPDMPKLTLPATFSMNGITFGIVGLSNVIRSNMRADLRIYLNKSLEKFDASFIAELINNYIAYAHKDNIWNINFEIGANQTNLVDALNESEMSYYGTIPFADVDGDLIGNTLMFQHTPQIFLINPAIKSQVYVSSSIFDTEVDNFEDIILLDDGYKMVRPDVIYADKAIFEHALTGYSKAMEDRYYFTIPLGEDKYMPQVGNLKYGLHKAMKNYNYIILDRDDNFTGFINIIREDKNKKHCEIEAGIIPIKQNQGIGRAVTNKFYEQLFALGYASVTTKVFAFNKKSNHLSSDIAEYNGRRIQSYYINGHLFDMNVYTKLNPLVEKVKIR